jgi:hypothetical protein
VIERGKKAGEHLGGIAKLWGNSVVCWHPCSVHVRLSLARGCVVEGCRETMRYPFSAADVDSRIALCDTHR